MATKYAYTRKEAEGALVSFLTDRRLYGGTEVHFDAITYVYKADGSFIETTVGAILDRLNKRGHGE